MSYESSPLSLNSYNIPVDGIFGGILISREEGI